MQFQQSIIQKLKEIFAKVDDLNAALLIGSFARGEASLLSDMDIQLWVDSSFSPSALLKKLEHELPDVYQGLWVPGKQKIGIYFSQSPKLDISFHYEKKNWLRYYLGSEIKNPQKSLLWDATGELADWLAKASPQKIDIHQEAPSLVKEFLYYFESCSALHRRGDAYQAYYHYNIALQRVVRLDNLLRQQGRFNYLPKGYHYLFNQEEVKEFYPLNGSLFLPDYNEKKRRLLKFFYTVLQSLEKAGISPDINKAMDFCEHIFHRDVFWNFRDAAEANPLIRPGRLFRSSQLSVYESDGLLEKALAEKSILTVIDLRAEREVIENPYSESIQKRVQYVQTPFDPWNQPSTFKASNDYGTSEAQAYRFFVKGCGQSIREIFRTLGNQETSGVVIHCVAGRDRTGIVLSLLHLLSGASSEVVYRDYLASEMNTQKNMIDILLQEVEEAGGIHAYLDRMGVDAVLRAKVSDHYFLNKKPIVL